MFSVNSAKQLPDQNLKILLIEDNDDHADLFLANLSLTAYAGAQVLRSDTLAGGFKHVRATPLDLLFIDLSLKDSGIQETMARLRELAAFCPTIVLTSLDDRRTILDIISKGADDCLPKMELNDALLERIIHFNRDRWRLRQELLRSKEAYKDLYHNSPNMLGATDAKTRILLNCNQTFACKLGWSRDEAIGQEIYTFYHPSCWEHFNQLFASFLMSGKISNAELQLVHKDGSRIDVLLNASAVRDDKGEISHTHSTWIDITEKKAADRQIQRMQRLNRLIIETIPDMLWMKDKAGVYLACNPRFEQCLGTAEAEIVGRTDSELLSKEQAEHCQAGDRQVAESGKSAMREASVTFAADGRKQLMEITKVPLFDEEGNVMAVMGIGHDITELREAAQKAEAASKAKSVFLSNMSHELRTPLNAILGYTQIFLGDESLTPRQLQGISTIHQAGEHLLLLINDILDISRIESGKLELIETEFCLGPFLKGIHDIIQLRAREKGLDYRDEISGLPTVIIADELRLRQVLLNLLSNAVKFTGYGWCSLKVRAENATPDGTRVRLHIAVEDSGAGISAEDQRLVFEPFLQVGERLQHREGTGLGLAISRELVRLMGGELKLISPVYGDAQPGVGPGSRFFFSIEVPVSGHRAGAARPQRKVSGYASVNRPNEPRRVLVVDDKLSNRAVLRDTLEPLGFIVHEAADGIEVPAACELFRPDIILMDLRMPKVDGFSATSLLKEQPEFRHIPVIAVTASIAEGEAFRQRCLMHGFIDYIHKPFSANELLEIMAEQLQVRLLHSEAAAEEAKAQDELVLPPQELLNELAWRAEIGEIQGLTEKTAEIAALEAGRYRTFARRVQELADDFQFEAMLQLISARKEEPSCSL